MFFWKPYVSVASRRARASREMEKLKKKGKKIQPVELSGRTIAKSFWGKGWCDHLESFSDFENRLPRGRSYIRNGSVCHLEIEKGLIQAFVSGSKLYKVKIEIASLKPALWKKVKKLCTGRIGSMLELLQGRLSDHVMEVVCHQTKGLFPLPGEIKMHCSCPDWAVMCKHVAAALYGVGSRLDAQPELLFLLRGVRAAELISAELAVPTGVGAVQDVLADQALSEIFGVDVESLKTPARPGRKTRRQTEPQEKSLNPRRSPHRTRRILNPARPTGKAIAKLRTSAGLTVPGFARAIGASASSVRRWESIPGALVIHSNPMSGLIEFQNRWLGRKA